MSVIMVQSSTVLPGRLDDALRNIGEMASVIQQHQGPRPRVSVSVLGGPETGTLHMTLESPDFSAVQSWTKRIVQTDATQRLDVASSQPDGPTTGMQRMMLQEIPLGEASPWPAEPMIVQSVTNRLRPGHTWGDVMKVSTEAKELVLGLGAASYRLWVVSAGGMMANALVTTIAFGGYDDFYGFLDRSSSDQGFSDARMRWEGGGDPISETLGVSVSREIALT